MDANAVIGWPIVAMKCPRQKRPATWVKALTPTIMRRSQICDPSCQGYAPYCGDGDITDGEVCDDGNNDDGDSVRTIARRIKPSAAMVSLRGRGCDDGFDINSDNYSVAPHCNAACTGFAPFCGDGFQDANEECDTGDLNTSEYSSLGICNQYCDAGQHIAVMERLPMMRSVTIETKFGRLFDRGWMQ